MDLNSGVVILVLSRSHFEFLYFVMFFHLMVQGLMLHGFTFCGRPVSLSPPFSRTILSFTEMGKNGKKTEDDDEVKTPAAYPPQHSAPSTEPFLSHFFGGAPGKPIS
jgi:hypothetical protein